MLVGPAHCTYLCKSSSGEVDNCCCGGPNDCSDNLPRCGENPAVVEMTGADAEILCGEWETWNAPSISSGERYNIKLNIKDIVKHPDYTVNIDTSAYLQNDIAVFKVNDEVLSQVNLCEMSKIKVVPLLGTHFKIKNIPSLSSFKSEECKCWFPFWLVQSNTFSYFINIWSWIYKSLQGLLQTSPIQNGYPG